MMRERTDSGTRTQATSVGRERVRKNDLFVSVIVIGEPPETLPRFENSRSFETTRLLLGLWIVQLS
jgi:hypothetical protein